MPQQTKYWCFTLNNPSILELQGLFKEDQMQYLVYQLERGEEGTTHAQGYVEYKKNKRFQTAKRLLSARVHLEPRKGTAVQARDYAMKEDTRTEGGGPWEYGEFINNTPGKRNDLVELYQHAKNGKRSAEVAELMPAAYMRHYKAFHHVRNVLSAERCSRRVYVLDGPPGLGKTHWVRTKYPDCYVTPVESKGFWFDGYEGHKVALIDDFSGQWPLKALLRVLHDWPEMLPVKGGFTRWNPEKIFITTNEYWRRWYKRENPEEHDVMIEAIARRIIHVNFHRGWEEPED